MATLSIPYKKGWYKAFLAALSVRGNIAESCETAGITKRVAYLARNDDERFAEAWDIAVDQAVSRLKEKLWTWAEEGDFPDKRALAERIVGRYDPQWKDTIKHEIDSRNVNLNIQAPQNLDELKEAVRILIQSGALKPEEIECRTHSPERGHKERDAEPSKRAPVPGTTILHQGPSLETRALWDSPWRPERTRITPGPQSPIGQRLF